jgi:hypothetical protein
MHEDDRETPIDDRTSPSEDGEAQTRQAPLVRLLANPRRVRRA